MNINLTPLETCENFCNKLGISPPIKFELLGHGEYNINYRIRLRDDEKASNICNWQKAAVLPLLRIPMGSQMHLENQVRYEYEALQLLQPSGRTPAPLYLDDTKSVIPYGFSVMSFLTGRPLCYETDLSAAAECLADIHALPIPDNTHLIAPQKPLAAMLDECNTMSLHYLKSDQGLPEVKQLIRELLENGRKLAENEPPITKRNIINTELNSSNFLVNPDKTYLVDWEKPLYASYGQDLGHFLAPTTTLWKTDTILTQTEIQSFIETYATSGKAAFHRLHASTSRSYEQFPSPEQIWAETRPYFIMTCLRGITWCAMAWIEYQSPDRPLKDEFTFNKLKHYLQPEFLEFIKKEYFT